MKSSDIVRFGRILSVQAEIEGMKVENLTKDLPAEAPAYSDADFQTKAQELSNLCYCPDEHL